MPHNMGVGDSSFFHKKAFCNKIQGCFCGRIRNDSEFKREKGEGSSGDSNKS